MPQPPSITRFRRVVQVGWTGLLSVVVLTIPLQGCVLVRQASNTPSQEKLRLISTTPGDYMFRVKNRDHRAASDGRIVLDVPRLPSDCNMYLFGVLKLRDGSPYNLKEIHLLQGERLIRKLSLSDIAKLPLDAEGYHLVHVK